jgi:ribosomal protein S18 acetylase RimI-like enzyme
VFRLLAVHPDARGRGVGRRLTEECLGRARTRGSVAVGLHTTVLMDVARAMYERMGFVRAPEHDFYPEPRFQVMAYRLTL